MRGKLLGYAGSHICHPVVICILFVVIHMRNGLLAFVIHGFNSPVLHL